MATTEPFVSFIIPTFRSHDYLARCLAGLQSLNYPEGKREIIVVDNGSDDALIAKEFTDQAYVEPKLNISGLRNFGAKRARGEILIFMDSDCILPAGWLSLAIEALKDERVGAVGSKTYDLPEGAGWVSRTWKIHLDCTASADQEVEWLPTLALGIRKKIFEEAGGFEEDLITGEDVLFSQALRRNYILKNLSELTPVHLRNPESLVELFKKELWRGTSSLKVSLQNIRRPKDFISFLLPLYFLFAFFLFLGGLIFSSAFILYFALAALVLPIMAMSIRTASKAGCRDQIFKLIAIYGTYVLARTVALFKFI